VIRALAHGEMHIRPRDVEGMTPGEIEVCLDGGPSRGRAPEGMRPMTPEEMADAARRRREMPLAEKVARAKRGL